MSVHDIFTLRFCTAGVRMVVVVIDAVYTVSYTHLDCTGEFERMDTSRVKDRIMRGIDALNEVSDHLVIVSINVFDEGMQQYDAWTRAYICLLYTSK